MTTAADSSRTGNLMLALANGARLLRSDPRGALEQAREIVRINPASADGFRLLAAALRRLDREDEAQQAELDAIAASASDSVLVSVVDAINEGRLADAERIVRPYLQQRPGDVAAIHALAEIAARAGALTEAETLLRRALSLAPRYVEARAVLARVIIELGQLPAGLDMLDQVLSQNPDDLNSHAVRAATLARLGDYEGAASAYSALLERKPSDAEKWIGYGHVLKTLGRRDEGVAAYRRAIDECPGSGEAWWSLANLKTKMLGPDDIEQMSKALATEVNENQRLQLHFATAKAFEDAQQFDEAFDHYEAGNRLRREMLPYDPGLISEQIKQSVSLFTPDFFEERAGMGALDPDPIFIVGMPRAGSTLVEQILASHPLIEGTSELPYISAIAARLGSGQWHAGRTPYLESIAGLSPKALAALGREYLDNAHHHRRSDRPFFIDKLPNNWMHLGLIRLILPNARIIDARRNPLDCCFSNYRQHFSQGQAFAYDLGDLGRYYRDYERLMLAWEEALPGWIHRLDHEQLVAEPEAETQRLLDHLGLAFDPACLRFYENDRAVRTPSSEQVRRPLNRSGFDQWRPYAHRLQPLIDALGPSLVK